MSMKISILIFGEDSELANNFPAATATSVTTKLEGVRKVTVTTRQHTSGNATTNATTSTTVVQPSNVSQPIACDVCDGGVVNELRSRLKDSTDTVNKQNETISKLSTQLRFVLPYLDIQQDDKSYIDWSSNEWPDLASAKSYGHSAVTAKQPAKTMREELLSAVYVVQSEKQKRSKSFMVVGLLEKYDNENDKAAFEMSRMRRQVRSNSAARQKQQQHPARSTELNPNVATFFASVQQSIIIPVEPGDATITDGGCTVNSLTGFSPDDHLVYDNQMQQHHLILIVLIWYPLSLVQQCSHVSYH